MTLTTHAITGAALATLMPSHPVLGFCAGFGSHFLLDAIPHWDYPILSDSIHPSKGGKLKFSRLLFLDGLRIGGDALLGLVLAALIFGYPYLLTPALIGAIGGITPDFLQFVYLRFPHPATSWLQRFHSWIHTRVGFEGRPVLGMTTQVIFVLLIVSLFKFI